jgi:hypothetical protein
MLLYTPGSPSRACSQISPLSLNLNPNDYLMLRGMKQADRSHCVRLQLYEEEEASAADYVRGAQVPRRFCHCTFVCVCVCVYVV